MKRVLPLLLGMLLGTGAWTAAMARKKTADAPEAAPRDTLLTIPRVTRAPDFDRIVQAAASAPRAAGDEARSSGKRSGKSKSASAGVAPETGSAAPAAAASPPGGGGAWGTAHAVPASLPVPAEPPDASPTATRADSLARLLGDLEQRLLRIEGRIGITDTAARSRPPAPDSGAATRAGAIETRILGIERWLAGQPPAAPPPAASAVPGSPGEAADLAARLAAVEQMVAALSIPAPPVAPVTAAPAAGSPAPAVRRPHTHVVGGDLPARSRPPAAPPDESLGEGGFYDPLEDEALEAETESAAAPGDTLALASTAVPGAGAGALPPAPAAPAGPGSVHRILNSPLSWMGAGCAAALLSWGLIGAIRAGRGSARTALAGTNGAAAGANGSSQESRREPAVDRRADGPGRHSAGPRAGRRARRGSRLRSMFFANLKRVKGSLLIAALFMIGGAAVELLKPWPMKVILDHAVLSRPLPDWLGFLNGVAGDAFVLLLVCAGAIVSISLIGGLFSYFEVFITKAIGYRMVYALRREVFSHLQRLSLSFHNRSRSGDLLTTFGKDTSTLKDIFAEAILKFADHTLTVVGMLVIMWMVNWKVALVACASLPLLCFTLMHLYRQTKLSLKKQRKQEGKVTSRVNEVLAAVPLVQAFARERHEEERYEEVSNETLRESIRMTRLEAAASRSSHIITALGTASAAMFGGMEVLGGRMLPGELVLLMSYVHSMYKPIRNLAKLSIEFSKASASAERIADVLEVEPEIQDRPDAIEADQLRGEVVFAAVSFDYGDGREVLRHVSFEVGPGQRLALVGVSGAGKSTIASLILRLYEAQQGAILIDGMDIERYRRESLRRQIGVVLQQSVLFGATIRENIAYGKPEATREEIVTAARAANADEFIRQLEDGYDSVIGERGVTLSAGQRQRIAIARAIIRNPRILILDEPMTGLDAENESKVREALDRLMVGKTTIMITHDLHSIADADQVLVVEDGRIVERGTHSELRARSGRYRELFDLRLHPATALSVGA